MIRERDAGALGEDARFIQAFVPDAADEDRHRRAPSLWSIGRHVAEVEVAFGSVHPVWLDLPHITLE